MKVGLLLVLFLLFTNPTFAQSETYQDIASDPGAVDIGESLISPSSPLYFLKAVRERIEYSLSFSKEAKVLRQLEFAGRRLREANSLIKKKEHDLIAPTVEKYKYHLQVLADLSVNNEELQLKIGENIARHLDVLARAYDNIGNPRAKMAIRSALEKGEERNRMILEKMEIVKQQQLISRISVRQVAACNFLERESTSSTLLEIERGELQRRVVDCRKGVRSLLKDQLEDIQKKRIDQTPKSTASPSALVAPL